MEKEIAGFQSETTPQNECKQCKIQPCASFEVQETFVLNNNVFVQLLKTKEIELCYAKVRVHYQGLLQSDIN